MTAARLRQASTRYERHCQPLARPAGVRESWLTRPRRYAMGTLGGGNGGERPSDGGNRPDGLPGLPPEWGRIVIPDDPADLAEEATEVRRELRREARRRRIRRLLRLPARPDPDEQSIRIPLIIMAIAI